MHFVGSTSPAGHFLPVVAGTAALAGAAQADHVIIDTDGMVAPAGLFLKWQMIDAVRPDALIAIERREELAQLRCATLVPVLRFAPSEAARRKSKTERAAARRRAFVAYFGDATTVNVPIEALAIQHSALAPRHWDLMPGRLCGTIDAPGWGSGLAIIAAIDRQRHRIGLVTPVAPAGIRALRPGSILLSRTAASFAAASTEEQQIEVEPGVRNVSRRFASIRPGLRSRTAADGRRPSAPNLIMVKAQRRSSVSTERCCRWRRGACVSGSKAATGLASSG